MSKRFLGLIAVLLCIAFVVPVFAGGGGEKGAAVPGGASLPWKGDPVVYNGFAADLGMKEPPDSPVVKAYRATTGNVSIKWETAPWNDYDTKMNLYLQSGDLPDIMWARDSVPKAVTYGPKGIFLDWNKYKQYMPIMQKWTVQLPHLNSVLTEKGERFAINDVTNASYVGEGFFYNPGMLKKAGYSAPPEDFNQMLDMMKKVKAVEPTADGFFSYWGVGYIQAAFGNAFDARSGVTYDVAAKKWIHGATMNPNYKKLIEYLNKCFQAKVFNPELMSMGAITDERSMELFEKGNYAFSYCYYGEHTSRWLNKGKPDLMEGMRPPKADNGKRYYWLTIANDQIPYWGYMANAKVKNPELLASYIDNVMSEKTYLLFEFGIEGLTYKLNSQGKPEFLPEYTGPDASAKLSALGVYNFFDPRYIHFSDYKWRWINVGHSNKAAADRRAVAGDIKALKAGQMEVIWSVSRPLMSAEANDEISKIMTPVNTFISEEQLKFITGQRKMSEWDDFLAQIKKLGDINKVLTYYNTGKQFPIVDKLYPDVPADLQ